MAITINEVMNNDVHAKIGIKMEFTHSAGGGGWHEPQTRECDLEQY